MFDHESHVTIKTCMNGRRFTLIDAKSENNGFLNTKISDGISKYIKKRHALLSGPGHGPGPFENLDPVLKFTALVENSILINSRVIIAA